MTDLLILLTENIAFVLFFVLLIFEYRDSSKLLQRIEKKTPKYYKLIGYPTISGFNFTRLMNGNRFIFDITFKLPDDFPSNKQLRDLALNVQKYSRASYVLLTIVAITSFL